MTPQSVPWWQRELNARLARRILRRAALRRLALRTAGALALTGVGGLLLLEVGQQTNGRLAQSARSHGRSRQQTATPTTLASLAHAQGATLTLDPPATNTTSGSTGSPLRVTLTDRSGAPLPGITIWLTITGLAPYNGVTTTNANGIATFPYGGTSGPYVVHIEAMADGNPLADSTVQVGGTAQIATTPVTGRFYASDDRCTFDTPASTPALFTARFPTLNFGGRPFTGFGVASDQQAHVAAGHGYTAGLGQLTHFDAAFTGSFVVHTPGDTSFTFLIDDAFNFGVRGATRVNGTMSNPPADHKTALLRLPIVGAFNQGHLQATTHVTVHFPHAGVFPYEIDYSECRLGGESLRVSTAGQFLSMSNQSRPATGATP